MFKIKFCHLLAFTFFQSLVSIVKCHGLTIYFYSIINVKRFGLIIYVTTSQNDQNK